MQVTINLDKDLVKRIDEIADYLHISRSAYISMTMSRAVNTEKVNEQLPLMAKNFNDFMANLFDLPEEEQKKMLKADCDDTQN